MFRRLHGATAAGSKRTPHAGRLVINVSRCFKANAVDEVLVRTQLEPGQLPWQRQRGEQVRRAFSRIDRVRWLVNRRSGRIDVCR